MKRVRNYINSLPVKRKLFLVMGFVTLNAFFVSIAFTSTRPAETAVFEPDYQKIMKMAFDNYDEAESALIYKDTDKCKKLLQKSEKYAVMAEPSKDFHSEAKELLARINTKNAEADKIVADFARQKQQAAQAAKQPTPAPKTKKN